MKKNYFIRNRLERLVDHDSIFFNANPDISIDEPYKRMIKCIIQHSKTLELVNPSKNELLNYHFDKKLF